jgi:phosphoribosyl 1,2-cyclic phosphodiesterase
VAVEEREMFIRIWGSRGSIPVSGKSYVKYGGDTTCVEIRTKDDRIIIVDAGTGIRRLGRRLMEEGRYSYDMIFTHAHWDHLMGFPFFEPLYTKRTRLRIQGCPFAQKFIQTMLSKIVDPPNFPVGYDNLKARIHYEPECMEHFQIGTVTVIPIPLCHPNDGNGYKFIEEDRAFVFLTDNELDYCHPGGRSFEEYRSFSEGADLLIHDGEFTPEEYKKTRRWGHSTYTRALDLAVQAGVKRLGLFHSNQARTDRQMDRLVEDCRKRAAQRGAKLQCFGVAADMTFKL